MPIVCFLNGYKNQNEKAPDYIIYLSESEESVRLAQRDPERVKKERVEMGGIPARNFSEPTPKEEIPIELPDDEQEVQKIMGDQGDEQLDLSRGIPGDNEEEIDVSKIPF